LKSLTSGGSETKIIALGIGSGVDQVELRGIASAPQDRNVILVQDFSDLSSVEEQLRNESCSRKHVVSFAVVIICCLSIFLTATSFSVTCSLIYR